MLQTFKCRTRPTEVGSPTYEVAVPSFSTGTAKEWIYFQHSLARVFTGQGDTIGPTQFAKTRQLLQGNALASFNTQVSGTANHTKTLDSLVLALNTVS